MPDAHGVALKVRPLTTCPADSFAPEERARLERRLARERAARREMEITYEKSLRDLFVREQESSLVRDVATAANGARSVREAFQQCLRRLSEFMAWPIGHAYEAARRDGCALLRPMPLWDLPDPGAALAFRSVTETSEFASGKGLPGRVHASRLPLWIEDLGSDPTFLRSREAEVSGLRSGCAFPILIGREVAAVFEFFTERRVPADSRLLGLMPQVGMQLGRAIERQRAEDRLIHDASHDALTGLPNRTLFVERLGQAIAHFRRSAKNPFAVLFIDLNRFKIVNDSLGHLAGDDLIVQVAARFTAVIRGASATLARLGGDEFTILLDGVSDPIDAVRVANRIQECLQGPFMIEGQELYTTASVGIASSASRYKSPDDILRDADLAMYRAKGLGGARCEVFDQNMHQAAMTRLALETDLRKALENQEFVLHYQPIVSLQTHEIVGFEALVRWRKRNGKLVPPSAFITVMEEAGLIVFLGRFVLREACRAIGALQRRWHGPSPLMMSVNISPRQFAQPDIVEEVGAVIEETGIAPSALRLEITESVTIGDTARAARVLRALKDLGVTLSIDDFGTGYSSLSYLNTLPIDGLKVDRSFVAAMGKGEGGLQIIRTIMGLARSLGMDVIAEGTEFPDQVAQLQSVGCKFGQGYYFSRPVDLASVMALLDHPTWAIERGPRSA